MEWSRTLKWKQKASGSNVYIYIYYKEKEFFQQNNFYIQKEKFAQLYFNHTYIFLIRKYQHKKKNSGTKEMTRNSILFFSFSSFLLHLSKFCLASYWSARTTREAVIEQDKLLKVCFSYSFSIFSSWILISFLNMLLMLLLTVNFFFFIGCFRWNPKH